MRLVEFKETLREIGLGSPPPFHRDGRFIAALTLGALFCLIWRAWFTNIPIGHAPIATAVLFSLVIWQPFMEEVLFRGIIQGYLLKTPLGTKKVVGISTANFGATALFSAGHFISHSPEWAVAVIFPSLIFGYFRERHRSAFPAIALHIAYNGFYLATLSRFALL